MLKLFYSPGACSLVTHIALEEAGAEFEAVRVMLAEGEHLRPDYLVINPKARVPALGTEQAVGTENIALLNFIADLYGKEGSVPRDDPYAALRCNELLGWFASTVHIAFAQFWRAERFTDDTSVHDAIIAGGMRNLERHFSEIEALAGDDWLVPGRFTAADSYALTFFRWGKRIGMDLGSHAGLAALCERALARPAAQRAIATEGLDAEQFRLG